MASVTLYIENIAISCFLHISALYWPILDIYGTLKSQFLRKYDLFTSLKLDFVE